MGDRASRKALLLVAVLLALMLLVADLVRQDSALRSTWNRLTRQDPPLEQFLKRFRQHRPERPPRTGLAPAAPALRAHLGV